MTRDNNLFPQQSSAEKRMLRRHTLYKATGFFFAVYIAGMLIYAAMLPGTLQIKHSIQINAPAEKIFGLISDFQQWQAWSPWEDNDDEIVRSYSGTGIGAAYVWQTVNDTINGRMEIIESTPDTSIQIKLDIMQTFEIHNIVTLTLIKQGDTTLVMQSVSGTLTYASRLLGLCFDMDKITGDKYMNGLARLKALTEESSPITAGTHSIHEH